MNDKRDFGSGKQLCVWPFLAQSKLHFENKNLTESQITVLSRGEGWLMATNEENNVFHPLHPQTTASNQSYQVFHPSSKIN